MAGNGNLKTISAHL